MFNTREELEQAVNTYLAQSNASIDEESKAALIDLLLNTNPDDTEPKIKYEERLKYCTLKDIVEFTESNR